MSTEARTRTHARRTRSRRVAPRAHQELAGACSILLSLGIVWPPVFAQTPLNLDDVDDRQPAAEVRAGCGARPGAAPVHADQGAGHRQRRARSRDAEVRRTRATTGSKASTCSRFPPARRSMSWRWSSASGASAARSSARKKRAPRTSRRSARPARESRRPGTAEPVHDLGGEHRAALVDHDRDRVSRHHAVSRRALHAEPAARITPRYNAGCRDRRAEPLNVVRRVQ